MSMTPSRLTTLAMVVAGAYATSAFAEPSSSAPAASPASVPPAPAEAKETAARGEPVSGQTTSTVGVVTAAAGNAGVSGEADAGPAAVIRPPAADAGSAPAPMAPRPVRRPAKTSPAPPAEVPSIPDPGIPLESLEPSQAPFPAAGSEGINVVTGDAGGHAYALGSARINAPIGKVYAALHDPNVLVDRRRVDAWTTDPAGDRMPAVFRVHNTVHGAAVVQFETTWREGVTEGTASKPRAVCARSKKTAGSGFIGLLEDSIVARATEGGGTSIELVRHLKGMNVGKKESEQYIRDVYANLLAKARGEPLPKYR
jgi:hypothetical protein